MTSSDAPEVLPDARVSTDRVLPLVVECTTADLDPARWAATNRDALSGLLHRSGALLFRGFTPGSLDDFHRFIAAVSGEPLTYQERSSPRHEISDRIYTSTDYPPDREIHLHNEQSYNVAWPMRIFFHCLVAPAAGGGTPVADCRKVYQRLSPQTRRPLEERGYMCTRHFGTGFGLSWREAFQTDDPSAVERYCLEHDITCSWASDGTLTTRQVRPTSARHPVTGEWTWFNHLTFFHVSTLGPVIAKALLSMGQENLPNNTYYGDGADIEPTVLEELRAAYAAEKVVVPWRAGDIMMIDNMLAAHGREAFTPPRRIAVGMTELYSAR